MVPIDRADRPARGRRHRVVGELGRQPADRAHPMGAAPAQESHDQRRAVAVADFRRGGMERMRAGQNRPIGRGQRQGGADMIAEPVGAALGRRARIVEARRHQGGFDRCHQRIAQIEGEGGAEPAVRRQARQGGPVMAEHDRRVRPHHGGGTGADILRLLHRQIDGIAGVEQGFPAREEVIEPDPHRHAAVDARGAQDGPDHRAGMRIGAVGAGQDHQLRPRDGGPPGQLHVQLPAQEPVGQRPVQHEAEQGQIEQQRGEAGGQQPRHSPRPSVMAGPEPAIRSGTRQGRAAIAGGDGRLKPGHDGGGRSPSARHPMTLPFRTGNKQTARPSARRTAPGR